MQAANAAQPTRIWTAFYVVYKKEGLRGLYRVSKGFRLLYVHLVTVCSLQGVGPTALRAAILTSVLMPTYDLTKTLILKYMMGDHTGTHIW